MFNPRLSSPKVVLLAATVLCWLTLLTGAECNLPTTPAESADTCPVPDSEINYQVIGFFDDRAFVSRSGSSSNSNSVQESLGKFDVKTSQSQTVFCDHSGVINEREIAWTDQDGLHVENLDSGNEVYADSSLVDRSENLHLVWVVGLSDTHVFIDRADLDNGDVDHDIFALNRVNKQILGITGWGDGRGVTYRPYVTLHGNNAAVIGDSSYYFNSFIMRILDITTGLSRTVISPGSERPYAAELTDQRFIWARQTTGSQPGTTATTVFAADLETLTVSTLVTFDDSTDENSPYAFSGDYMLVSHTTQAGKTYDLWGLAGTPVLIRTFATDVQPYFVGSSILLTDPSNSMFTLVDIVTGSETMISNPFLE